MQKRPPANYLHFTRKERKATLLLLSIVLLLINVPFLYSLFFKEKRVMVNDEIQHSLAVLQTKPADDLKRSFSQQKQASRTFNNDDGKPLNAVLFKFDPNTLPAAGWEKLGIKGNTIHTILNYVSKGGKFREPGDLRKIWGLHEEQVNRLIPYVEITAAVPQSKQDNKGFEKYEKPGYLKKPGVIQVDINLSDTSAWISLPGIGPKLSGRIVNFRNRLGGFYSIDQVAETFGLPDSVFQKIRPMLVISANTLQPVNINTAGFDQLKAHPYIRYQLAGQIVQYRAQHGGFTNIDDLRKIMTITDDIYNKVKPYLTVQQ